FEIYDYTSEVYVNLGGVEARNFEGVTLTILQHNAGAESRSRRYFDEQKIRSFNIAPKLICFFFN
ncbi:MAG: hypothetical protein ACRC3B_22400, partial [Bacteroidia bacterium]